jgi:hypothetical protein
MPGVVLGQRRWPGVWNLTVRASGNLDSIPPRQTIAQITRSFKSTQGAFGARLRSIPHVSSGLGLDLSGLLDFAQGRS